MYGIIRCTFEDNQKQKEYWEDMYRDIEDLSGDGENLYVYRDNNTDMCVLAVVEEEYRLVEVMELLQSLFEAKRLSAQIVITAVSHDLRSFENRTENNQQEIAEGKELGKSSMAGAVVEYIKTNCTDYNLSLDLLAQEFQITPQYLCKIIKQQTGISYKEYLTGLRMDEAKKLLKDKNISVIDACQQSGYNNVSYFIKVFQKYTGETPAKYRDEH